MVECPGTTGGEVGDKIKYVKYKWLNALDQLFWLLCQIHF